MYQQIVNNDIKSHKEIARRLKNEAELGDLNVYRKTSQQLFHMLNYAEDKLDERPLMDTEGGRKKKQKVGKKA